MKVLKLRIKLKGKQLCSVHISIVGLYVISMDLFLLLDVLFFFFFQAEDGIRDIGVTGVQTCALPISTSPSTVLVVDADTDDRRDDEEGEDVRAGVDDEHGGWTRRDDEQARDHRAGELRQIGRASCRERGEVSRGGGLVEK